MQAPTTAINVKAGSRIHSIDLLRGIVIIIMALDHVRDYFHADNFLYDPTDFSHTTPVVFFTRWITHFCAPVFMFLSGTSAFFVGERKTKKHLSTFLLTRGLWLMLLELTVVNFAWRFNPAFPFFGLAVIWALGCCMVILAALIHLPKQIILIIGLLILCMHNMLDDIHATGDSWKDILWAELHERKRFTIAGHVVATGYPLLAWIGIMSLGYCFGQLYKKGIDAAVRKKYLLTIGCAATILFLLIRGINMYGDKEPWNVQSTFIMTVCSFLNTTKYPPSLLYALMTLGPAIVFLAFAEKTLGWLGNKIIHFGRVPLFFYILHLYLIHLLAVIAVVLSGHPWTDMITTSNLNVSDCPWLKGYGFSLGIVYLVWLLVVLMLYPLCKWYDGYKQSHKEKWWLSYL
jgi:uncharacterized membrane protein